MARIAVIARGGNSLAINLTDALRRQRPGTQFNLLFPGSSISDPVDGAVYLPTSCDRNGMLPDLAEAESLIRQSSQLEDKKLVVISSALIYGAGPSRQSLVGENYRAAADGSRGVADHWKSLENLVYKNFTGRVPLTILRPVTVVPSQALLSRRILRKFPLTLPGHNPLVQLLSISDLAQAVLCVMEQDCVGTFNVAPDDVVPLRAIIRLAGGHRLPLLRSLQRMAAGKEALEYLRYPWTVSNKKIKQCKFRPEKSSITALRELHQQDDSSDFPEPIFDEFGMDRHTIDFYGKTIFKFFWKWYWRIETKGLEHLPQQGPAILVGTHRGFVPFDAFMALHAVVQRTGRVPRFLTHPGLLKVPFIGDFMRKLGGVVACQESADRVLQNGDMLGVFPEGIRGAFARYRGAYQLKSFGRDSFVKLALRHHVPIIPFVTVGSAEVFPILTQIKSRRWRRYSDWPCIPVSTFPFLPVPLPTKWHMQFLPAIHLENYGPEAAHDRSIVEAVSLDVRSRMQQAVNETVSKRRSVWFGSVFGQKSAE